MTIRRSQLDATRSSPLAQGLARGGFPDFQPPGDHGGYSYSPAESASILPQTAIWISQQGVTQAGTVSAWASYLGGLTCTVTQATGSLQPAYSASGGVGSRPLITFDGVDDVLKGAISAKGSAYSSFEMGVVGQRVAWGAGTDFWMGYEVTGSIIWGIRDGATAATFRGTDIALYDLASTSDPDGVNRHYSFNGGTSLGQVRTNGTVEASNATTCTGAADNRDVAIGGRTTTSAYANIAIQAFSMGVQLDAAQRTYLRYLLTFYTGIAS